MNVRVLAWAILMAGASTPALAEKFDRKTAAFSIAVRGVTSPYRDFSFFVLPDAKVGIRAVDGPAGTYELTTKAGIAEPLGASRWRWTAPSRPGLYSIKIEGPDEKRGKDTVTLHAFVLVPFTQVRNGWLHGYRIGAYPPPLKGNPIYRPPVGFVEVTHENEDTKLSPHFELKQFICKEDTTRQYPKYVVVQEALLLKLEAVLQRVNALGFKTDTLHVMSAYRTPFYNRAIGDVRYSMHQFGSAADIYVDPDNKGLMADLNRDGVIDLGDSKFLHDEIDRMLATGPYRALEGGLGFYRATPAHPPFVHVDVRGTRARWQG